MAHNASLLYTHTYTHTHTHTHYTHRIEIYNILSISLTKL